MKGFNLPTSNSCPRTTPEPGSFKRSAKAFSFKKPSLNFHKNTQLPPRNSHDRPALKPTPPPTARTDAQTPEFSHGDDVICISREDSFDISSIHEISHDELQTPSNSPYASSYSSLSSSSSSSSCHLPPEIEDRPPHPDEEIDPRRGSQLSMVSSWVHHHLQELDLSYGEHGVYEIEIVTTADGFPSRRDSFILPPGETFQSFQRKRNLPVVPQKQLSRLSRPLPSTPPSPGFVFNPQSRPVRPLPPPPSPW